MRVIHTMYVPDGKEREMMYKLMARPNNDAETRMHDLSEVEDGVGGLANKRTRGGCYAFSAWGSVYRRFEEMKSE